MFKFVKPDLLAHEDFHPVRSPCDGPNCVYGPLTTSSQSLQRIHKVNGTVLRAGYTSDVEKRTFVNLELESLCLTHVEKNLIFQASKALARFRQILAMLARLSPEATLSASH